MGVRPAFEDVASPNPAYTPCSHHLDHLVKALKQDYRRIHAYEAGSGFTRRLNTWRTPGLHAMIAYRLGHWLLGQSLLVKILCLPVYFILSRRSRTHWGIEIARLATIGPGCYIGHFGGITIGPGTIIGENVTISQQVVLGLSGSGDKLGEPTIGDDVYIGPGAKVFGLIKVGNNAKIGANAVIHKDIPDNAVVVMKPGFEIISYAGNRQKASG